MLDTLLNPPSTAKFFPEYRPGRCYVSHGDLTRLPRLLHTGNLTDFEALARSDRRRVR